MNLAMVQRWYFYGGDGMFLNSKPGQTYPMPSWPDEYPDPLPDGLQRIGVGGWSAHITAITSAINEPTKQPSFVEATATLFGPNGEVLDRMTLSFPTGATTPPSYVEMIGTPSFTILNGEMANDAYETESPRGDGYGEFFQGGRTKWVGPKYFYYAYIDGGDSFDVAFPASRISIPPGSSIRVDTNAVGYVEWFGWYASPNNIFFESSFDPPVVTVQARGYQPSDFSEGLDKLPYSPTAAIEYWWKDGDTGEWRSSVSAEWQDELYLPRDVFIVHKDVDGGQRSLRAPLWVHERIYERADEVKLRNGRVLRAEEVEYQPVNPNVLYNPEYRFKSVVLPRAIEITEVKEGPRHVLFRQPGNVDIPGRYRTPNLLVMRRGIVLFWMTNNPQGADHPGVRGGIEGPYASRNEGETWTLTWTNLFHRMWNSPYIRGAKLCELTDGALVSVAVSSTMWFPWGQNTAETTATRKLLWKRSDSIGTGGTQALTIDWPDDEDAVEIATIDRVEIWAVRQNRDGSIEVFNGRGQKYISNTANPSSSADFEFVDDTAPAGGGA